MKELKLYESIPVLENNFAVKFRIYENDSALIPHWHEHIELMYLCQGECDFHVGGHSYIAYPGDLMIVNSAKIHSFTVKNRIRFYSLLLFPSFFEDLNDTEISLCNIVKNDGHVKDIFEEMASEYESKRDCFDMMLKGNAYKLLGYLCRSYAQGECDGASSGRSFKRLYSLLEYISDNYREKITTKDLAAHCFLSEEHLCRFFKSAVGKTITEYINQYRVEKASILLLNTDESIASIGESVGFDDLNYFSRVFKKTRGMSPKEYRSQYTKEAQRQR
jgi:AraC-like DNA-binding protein